MECGLCGHLRYSNYEALASNSVQTTHSTLTYAFTLHLTTSKFRAATYEISNALNTTPKQLQETNNAHVTACA